MIKLKDINKDDKGKGDTVTRAKKTDRVGKMKECNR
jgi:hypothetical protein